MNKCNVNAKHSPQRSFGLPSLFTICSGRRELAHRCMVNRQHQVYIDDLTLKNVLRFEGVLQTRKRQYNGFRTVVRQHFKSFRTHPVCKHEAHVVPVVHAWEHRPVPSVKVKFITDASMTLNKANIVRYRCTSDTSNPDLSFEYHIKQITRTAFFYLHFSQDNHVLDLSIYCYMTWTCRFNFGGVDDLREALPASSMQHIHT